MKLYNLACLTAVSGLALSTIANADTIVFNYDRQVGNQWGYTVGMDFTVNSAVTVSGLGTFDSNLTGLSDPVTTAQINASLQQGISSGDVPKIQVGIFDNATGLEVSPTASFFYNDPNIANYYAVAGSIFQNITPFSLPPGSYSIVAGGYNYLLAFGNIKAPLPPTTGAFDTLLGSLTLTGSARVNGNGFGIPPLAYPNNYSEVETAPDFLAGTFIATPSGVPDSASSMALLSGTVLGLSFLRRKLKR